MHVRPIDLPSGYRESVGLLDFLSVNQVASKPETKPSITAADFPLSAPASMWGQQSTWQYCNYDEAMTVPALARSRNIIAGTVATLELEAYNSTTGDEIPTRPLLKQPDPGMPYSVTMAWTVSDLIFHPFAYWQILGLDPEDGRPSQARRIDPTRVTYKTDVRTSTVITGYQVDGRDVPNLGVNSLIAFPGIDGGLLARAGRTLATAIKLEQAALRLADEPAPQTYLKNTGADLPAEQVTNLMNSWKLSRQTRATAYLNSAVDLREVGFDAMQMQLVEARKYTTELIAHLVGIPSYYLNADTASNTYSNTLQERRNLVDFSLKPLMCAISERLSMDDVTPRGQRIRFDLDSYLRGAPLERIEVIAKMLEIGLINLDEARAMEDLPPQGGSNGVDI